MSTGPQWADSRRAGGAVVGESSSALPEPDRRARFDAGMVTAELAVALPALVLVLAGCLTGLGAVVDQVRCVDAARLAARAAARGDTPSAVRADAVRAAPGGATVSVTEMGQHVRVVVRATARGWAGLLPSFDLSATAITPVEKQGG